MNQKTLEKIQSRFCSDKDQQSYFNAYDDMDNMKWEIPNGWLSKTWIRKQVNTDAHDALKTMTNIFDTYAPKWDILPLSEDDKDRADRLALWLDFFMRKANAAGETSPFRKGLHNSGKFNRVIFEVDYLPYWLPKNKNSWTPEQKANARYGPFCITAHDPRCIYYEFGKYGLMWVANIAHMEGQNIIDHWSIYESNTKVGKQIKAGIAKIKSVLADDEESSFIYLDFTTHSDRGVIAIKTKNSDVSDIEEFDFESGDYITILDTKNELGFIPYAVATGDSDPLLHSMHVGGAWENENMIQTINDSSVLRRAFFPPLKHTSQTGAELDISYDGSQDVIELGIGESADVMSPPPIDPGLQQLAAINAQRMSKSTGIGSLGSQDIAGNVQFSTVQAQIHLMLTNLTPYERTYEKCMSEAGLLMFRWVEFTGDTLTAYVTNPKMEGQVRGQPVTVGVDDFDPDTMIITCELLSNAPTDKQQEVNMYTTLKQAGAPIAWNELLERLGLGSAIQLKQGHIDEQIEMMALSDMADKVKAKTQLEVQAQQMQMQMAQQQQQMQAQQQMQQQQMQSQQQVAASGGNPDQTDPLLQNAGGQQNNPAAGGQPAAMNAETLTRNNVRNGQ